MPQALRTAPLRTLIAPALLLALLAGGCSQQRTPAAQGAVSHKDPQQNDQPSTRSGGGSGEKAAMNRADSLREEMRVVVSQARDKVFPALVNISVITVNYYGGKETKGGSIGSGTIISPDGYILTNQHVTDSGKKYRVTLADRTELPATMVGEDPLTDLAVLKIDPGSYKGPLPYASFGDSDKLMVGDYVMAMGSPLALSRSVTLGIVSNTERVFTSGMGGDEVEEMEFDAGRTGLFTSWIQHDANINHGNSGGPLVNLRGEVIGVNALGGQNMGFAIPAALARDVARELIDKGEVVRSQVGIALKPIKRSEFKEGVFINSVVKDSPADKAGLKAGDLITALDGKPVTVKFAEEVPTFVRMISSKPVGTKMSVEYSRGGEKATTTLVTEKLLKERGDQTALRMWGVSLSQITEKMAKDRQLASTKGAIVTGLRSGGPASQAEPALSYGDIIKTVDGKPVETLEQAVEVYKKIMSGEPIPEFVLIEFDRRGKNQVTLIKPRPDKTQDPPREVPKSWIGIATQPVLRDLAKQLGHEGTLGFRVTRVYPGTLAYTSGLQVGDVITAINGDKMAPRSIQESGMLERKIRQLGGNDKATLAVLRNGETIELSVPLERTRIGPSEALKEQNKDFELSVRELTFFDRDDNRWEDSVNGVLVENVEDAGWAGLAGIGYGDLIQKVNQHEIKDIHSFRKAMAEIAKAQPERVTFGVLRGNRTYFMFAEPEWKPVVTGEKGEKKTEGAPAAAEGAPAKGESTEKK
ncbi:MAG TPA: PDZ domain-containing protein [Phycisphaerales bacterium]|nr:PDZ domain-containing protein [Phycisphaerales bacterium]